MPTYILQEDSHSAYQVIGVIDCPAQQIDARNILVAGVVIEFANPVLIENSDNQNQKKET